MRLTKQIVTCPVCSGTFFGAVIKSDKQDHDATCPRCRNRFSVAGFLGRLSDIFPKKVVERSQSL